MKSLIWVVCILVSGAVQGMIRSNGITLGGIPTALIYLATVGIANALSRKWDEKHRK